MVAKRRRRNLHKEIIDPGIEHLEGLGALCQNYHSPRAMPPTLKGHPDLVVMWSGITWYVEVKPDIAGRKPPLNFNQCAWFWRYYSQFCATIRYVIATNVPDLLDRVSLNSMYDISAPERYHEKLVKWKEENE